MMAHPALQVPPGRRGFLQAAASAGSLALVACAASGAMHRGPALTGEKEHEEAEVTPGEDLMQEHGVLERILLIYDEAARRIEWSWVATVTRELGEQFEEKEHALFGERGFENTVRDIARLKTALGIGDLTRFTP